MEGGIEDGGEESGDDSDNTAAVEERSPCTDDLLVPPVSLSPGTWGQSGGDPVQVSLSPGTQGESGGEPVSLVRNDAHGSGSDDNDKDEVPNRDSAHGDQDKDEGRNGAHISGSDDDEEDKDEVRDRDGVGGGQDEDEDRDWTSGDEDKDEVSESNKVPDGGDTHNEGGGNGSGDNDDLSPQLDSVSICSAASAASSFLHGGKEGETSVQRLVRRNILKKQKELARLTRPRKESKRVAAGSQNRDRKAQKRKIKESLEVEFF